jgi:hypothetical protein
MVTGDRHRSSTELGTTSRDLRGPAHERPGPLSEQNQQLGGTVRRLLGRTLLTVRCPRAAFPRLIVRPHHDTTGGHALASAGPGKDEHDDVAAGHDRLMRYVELRRHTDNEGDRLASQGVADAEMIGRDRLHPPYAAFVSTGAARATQMLEILRHATGQDDTPITIAAGLRSSAEDRWREVAKAAGKGADLDAMRAIAPELVERESLLLASALRHVFGGLARWRPGAGGGP